MIPIFRHRGIMEDLWIYIILLFNLYGTVISNPYALVNELFETRSPKYNPIVRPVFNDNSTVTVYHEIVPRHIANFDEVKQQVTIVAWLRQSWQDEFLNWDPKDFNGTDILRIPSHKLWRPDVVLYNSVSDDSYRSPLPISVNYNGDVAYMTPYIYICYCKVDLTYYPFDTQTCNLKFGSWAHDKLQVDIWSPVEEGEITSYQPNGEWDLIGCNILREEQQYSCCPNKYSTVTFSLIVKRNSDFYIYNLILPYLMISLLSIFVFYLPPDSGEKMTLSITVMLSLVVFNQLVFASIPPASDGTFPIIGKYFIVMIAMVACSVIMSVISLHIFHQQSSFEKMPLWLHKFIFSFLARIVCSYSSPSQTNTRHIDFQQSLIRKETLDLEELANGYHTGESESLLDSTYVSSNTYQTQSCFTKGVWKVEKEIRRIAKSLEYLTLRKRQKEKDLSVAEEWKDGAAIVDRTLLLIFVTVNTVFPLFFILAATGLFVVET